MIHLQEILRDHHVGHKERVHVGARDLLHIPLILQLAIHFRLIGGDQVSQSLGVDRLFKFFPMVGT